MNDRIRPGQPWFDTEGKRIQAHGAQLFFENNTYYWIGENKEHTTGTDEIWTWGIRLYSSCDLYNWKDEGLIVAPDTENKNSIFHPSRHMDRPHLLFNERTKKYVLWLKYCDDAHYAVLTADKLKGPYTVVNARYFPYGAKCGDYDLAKDESTGNGYIYFEVNHSDVWAAKLNADYTETEGEPYVIYTGLKPPMTREAVTHLYRNGKHYLITSGMTGYRPNPSEVAVSDNWLTGYVVQGDPHVGDKSRTSFHSQISSVFKIPGKDFYIALADRWRPDLNDWSYTGDMQPDPDMKKRIAERLQMLGLDPVKDREKAMKVAIAVTEECDTSVADYVWLPLEFRGETLKINWKDEWKVEEYEKFLP